MIENLDVYNYVQMIIWLFFTYSFAGWFMESFGHLVLEKSFIDRGFLIGPLCPVYGVGASIITILLSKYTNDLFALFILATVICGVLEYLTSYVMEKLFNARWWDYSERRFNINGRICLENLILFGTFAVIIVCITNPFLINIYMTIPPNIRNIITIVAMVTFGIDFIISFRIISSFKGVTFATKMDNTEEISSKVKDKTEDMIKQAELDVRESLKKLKLKPIEFIPKIRYTRANHTKYTLQEIKEKINSDREKIKNKIDKARSDFEERVKAIRTKSIEEISKEIKDKFSKQSMLNGRLIKAFPNMEIKFNNKKTLTNEESKK